MKRIGIMGGTFDPVHNGHLLLGKQAYMEYQLDEIWYMPSHIPPHKKDHHVTDSESRLAMLYLKEAYCADIRLLHNEEVDIASAEIRKRAAEGKDIRKAVPEAVADYIEAHGLYHIGA